MKISKLVLGSFFGLLLTGQSVLADTCSTGLMPLFTGPQAKEICATFSAGTIGVLANNTYAVGRNAANSANINAWKINSSDDTVINSSASDDLILQLEDDANRLISFDAASDTALAMKFGDGGTTAAQVLSITGSTADADDDSILNLAAGGAQDDSARGANIRLKGNEASGGGDVNIEGGNTNGSDIVIRANHVSSTVGLYSGAGTLAVTVEADQDLLLVGDPYAADGADFGLTAANGANTACNTTCTTGCVIGWDQGTTVFVGCASALADSCVCTK